MGAFDRQPHGKGAGKIDAPLPVDLALHDEGLPVHLLQGLLLQRLLCDIRPSSHNTLAKTTITYICHQHHSTYSACHALLGFVTRLARCTSKGAIKVMLVPELILLRVVVGLVVGMRMQYA